MSLTNTGENTMLTLFKESKTHYLALFTVAPSESGGGTEVTGGAYARQAVTFGAPASGSMSNSAVIEFPTATANWGTAKAWGLFDAATSGNLIWYGNIDTPKELLAGDIYRINAGSLTLTMD
jgi:hypothetical protein